MRTRFSLFFWLLFFGLCGYVVPVQAAYVLMGVYTSHEAAADACKTHRNHPATNELCATASNTLDGTINACALQDILYHDGDAGNYGVEGIWPDRYGFVSTEDCGGACPTGYTEDGSGACVADVDCPVGDEQRFHGDAGEPIPESVCSNGCWYEAKYDDVPVTFAMGTHAWSGNFISTGHACEAGGGPGGPPDNPPLNCISDSYGNTFCAGIGPDNAPPNCMEDQAGNQACIDAYDPLNCGYLNGDKICYDDYPDQAECHFIPGGSYICFPGDEQPQSPPYPDTGTPGEPAEPDIQMQQSDGAGGPGNPIDYFNPETVDQSSGEGGAPGATSDKTPDETVQLEGPIQIDETGTPSAGSGIFDSHFDSIGLDQVESDIQAIGAGSSSPMPEMPTALTAVDQLIPPTGQCSDPQILFMGHTMTIRFGEGAADFRDLLGWVLYVITALYLFYLVQGLPKKTR